MICSGIKENGVVLPLHVFLSSRKRTLDYEELERPLRQTKLSEVIWQQRLHNTNTEPFQFWFIIRGAGAAAPAPETRMQVQRAAASQPPTSILFRFES